jgi:hypothetical protein
MQRLDLGKLAFIVYSTCNSKLHKSKPVKPVLKAEIQ